MLVFLWILFSLGVAYAAKLQGRNIVWWFMLAVMLSPLVASLIMFALNRWPIFGRRT